MTPQVLNSDVNSSRPAPSFLAALAGTPSAQLARTPVWFMRQAGRSLPEYRHLRAEASRAMSASSPAPGADRSASSSPDASSSPAPSSSQPQGPDMLDACLWPQLAAELTLQPVRRHGVDAAVFFSDIMVPLRLAGVDVRIAPGVGPLMAQPVRSRQDIERLVARRYGQPGHEQEVEALTHAVGLVVHELGTPQRAPERESSPCGRTLTPREQAGLAQSAGQAGWTPVIAFGGAPFTLAAYLVEGKPSRDHLAARALMHADPDSWDMLMTWCADLTASFITTQIRAGASAAQLFDSWAGSLSPEDYRERVMPYSARALAAVRRSVSPTTGTTPPLIHFGTGTARILPDMRDAGADAVGVDDRTSLTEALERLDGAGGACPLQGNIDPALLGAGWGVVEQATERCLDQGRQAPGHVVNLGHGVPPSTDPRVLTALVAHVHGDASWAQVAAEGIEPVALEDLSLSRVDS